MRKILSSFNKYRILWIAIFELILVVVLFLLGFRITYNPQLENNWVAIEACGTWFCGCIIPIAVVFIQRRISESEKKTSASNTALLEEIEQIKKNDNDKTRQEHVKRRISSDEIYRYICIKMIASTEEIAEHFNVEVDDITHQLEDLWAVTEMISTVSLEDNPNDNIAKCHWKKS